MKKKRTKNSLRRRIRELEAELEATKADRAYAQRRLRAAGMDEGLMYDMEKTQGTRHLTESVNIRPIPYGTYMVLAEELEKDEDIDLTERKEFLVKQMVKDMMKWNLVRFIYHPPARFSPLNQYPMNQYATLGIRLDVVPWEQLIKKEDK